MQQDISFTTQEIKMFISMAEGFGHTKIETMLRNYQEGRPFCTIVVPDAEDSASYLNK